VGANKVRGGTIFRGMGSRRIGNSLFSHHYPLKAPSLSSEDNYREVCG